MTDSQLGESDMQNSDTQIQQHTRTYATAFEPCSFLGGQVSAALAGYLAAVEETETTVRLELQELSDMLVANNDLPVIAQVDVHP